MEIFSNLPALNKGILHALRGVRDAFAISLEQISDIFGHDDSISVENSEIITNESDRLKVSQAINDMLEEQLENARNNKIKELVEDVQLQNGKITIRL